MITAYTEHYPITFCQHNHWSFCHGIPWSTSTEYTLTLLALSNMLPDENWKDAYASNKTLSKDIINFVNLNYQTDYKANSRESFRKIALKPFVDNNIALLNPDEPDLSTTSSRTHYLLSDLALKAIQQFNSDKWDEAVNYFIKNQFVRNIPSDVLLKRVSIKNYKSVIDDTIELGIFNVFIGANGTGKSNILEALAFFGAAENSDATYEGLYSRGIRTAKPSLTISSFLGTTQNTSIDFSLLFKNKEKEELYESSLEPREKDDIYTNWFDKTKYYAANDFFQVLKDIWNNNPQINSKDLNQVIEDKAIEYNLKIEQAFIGFISNYSIFDLNTKSLRGISPTDSRKTPLGLNGEGLDLLIANFNSYERGFLENNIKTFFDWIDKISNEKDEKMLGLKAGRSSSTLYFTDKFMQKQNNVLSAENSNEGILHVLFYLALFISTKTPNFFAIDNIETALNPRLCQVLMMLLTDLAKQRGKQVLITTHNPAILDGLNLLDDSVRLFEVSRNSHGHTKTRRIKFRSDLKDKPSKLSDMWLKGILGATPKNF